MLARQISAHRLLALIVAIFLVVAAWFMWLQARDMSVLRVKHVEIEGVNGPEAPAIERALRQSAGRMTTLHIKEDQLEQAVDRFPVVRSVSASAHFPNTIRISVEEHEPVAVLASSDGRRVAVSAEGVMLRGIGPNARLPEVEVDALPESRTLDRGPAHVLVTVLGGAPAPLRSVLERAYVAAKGVRVVVRDGPLIEFGDAERIEAKWAAAARVLADPTSSGARVIDVRLPERPAASDSDAGSSSASAGTTGDAGDTQASAAPAGASDQAGQAPEPAETYTQP